MFLKNKKPACSKKFKRLSIVFFVIFFPALTIAGLITPADFGSLSKTEDFEGLANTTFLTVINSSNPHYLVDCDYYFNEDFRVTYPKSNPPYPEDPFKIGSVVIGDFSQGSHFWGLDDRTIDNVSDIFSGSSYLGIVTLAGDPAKVTFSFKNPVYKVGAWVDSSQYWDEPLTFEIFNSTGDIIEYISTFSESWSFVGLESITPIHSVSFTGYNPVIDFFTYEVPEPISFLIFAIGLPYLLRRKFSRH